MNFSIFAILLGIVGVTWGSPLSALHGTRVARDVGGAAPPRCVIPPLWEAKSTIITKQGNASPTAPLTTNIAYDRNNRRMRAESFIDVTNGINQYIHIKDDHLITYLPVTEKCFTNDVSTDMMFKTYEVSANATYFGRTKLGDVWHHKQGFPVFPGPNLKTGMADIYLTLTDDGSCLPVSITAHLSSLKVNATISFDDITIGIKDTSIWAIPDYC
ncbi:uncharacterized protein LOC135494248 [Lineus longissimus]|uniref:uncharacterized protein LOC135494248 n=1 Tax=Lineus longissimus TaxID=88925 RepID=UPI00315D35F5